jgi:hypothetical protein
MNLASLIINYMRQKNYVVSSSPGECNIIYIEGMNENGSLNNDTPNEFNDRRIIIDFVNDSPRILNHWQATTEPGNYYTYNPLNSSGAARIAFGQYRAWTVGTHGNAEPHEALVQVRPVTVCRDFNQDFKRTGDRLDVGHFGINQHWGYDAPITDIKNTSAGCLVGRRRQGHKEFMQIIKSDRRYQIDNNYIFYTTVIAGDDLLKYC